MTEESYTKLYHSILRSSVWSESATTRCVWIAMLGMVDYRTGIVYTSFPGLVREANVTTAEAKEAVRVLEAPDLDSKSQEWGGRRIEKVDGGWLILNYAKYRDKRTTKQVQGAIRQRRYAERHLTHADAQRKDVDVDVNKGGRSGPRIDVGPASLLLVKIRELAETNGTHRYIRRDRVVELGDHVAKAFDAVGGTERILGAVGKEHSFLAREFAAAMAAAQQ